MRQFLKSIRHPDIANLANRWRTLARVINISDESQLSDIPDLANAAHSVQKSKTCDYFPPAREVLGASAVRAIAKCYEALDALRQCEHHKVNVSGSMQAYSASFFAARGFCMLMGFGPLDRSSPITVDAFRDRLQSKSRSPVLHEEIGLYKFGRWGHNEVWSLASRLIRTAKIPDALKPARDWLTRAKLTNSSKVRNSFHYDDSKLAPFNDPSYVDFPDVAIKSIFDSNAPVDLSHQFFIAQNLLSICNEVLQQAQMTQLLQSCVSLRRRGLV